MATTVITAVSPGLPTEQLGRTPEGGVEAALAAAAQLLPDLSFEQHATSTWTGTDDAGDAAVRLATYGPTVILFGLEPEELTVAGGLGTYGLVYQSVSMSYAIAVDADPYHREAALGADGWELDEGEPLPFEAPFLERPEPDADEWARVGALWMFGYDQSGTVAGGYDPRVQPMHVLTLGSREEPRPTGRLRRLLRR